MRDRGNIDQVLTVPIMDLFFIDLSQDIRILLRGLPPDHPFIRALYPLGLDLREELLSGHLPDPATLDGVQQVQMAAQMVPFKPRSRSRKADQDSIFRSLGLDKSLASFLDLL